MPAKTFQFEVRSEERSGEPIVVGCRVCGPALPGYANDKLATPLWSEKLARETRAMQFNSVYLPLPLSL
jgi:hypothetical protein